MKIDVIFSLFFPLLCYGCGDVGSYLCDICKYKKIFRTPSQRCHVCKREIGTEQFLHEMCYEKTSLDGVIVAVRYDKFIEKLVTDFKYEFVTDLKNLLGYFLVDALKISTLDIENLNLTFVPLHQKREKWRGYNQAKLLAENVAKKMNIPISNLLERRKYTKTQVGLHRKERLNNLNDAFESNDHLPEKVLIIDDVMTTGSTLEECAKTLKEAGVEKVFGLVIARG